MCEFFGVSRAVYYARVKRLEQPDPNAERKQLIQEAYEKSHKIYGYRRVALWIHKNKSVCINPKAVLRLMNTMNIRSLARKRKVYKKGAQLHTYIAMKTYSTASSQPASRIRNGSRIFPILIRNKAGVIYPRSKTCTMALLWRTTVTQTTHLDCSPAQSDKPKKRKGHCWTDPPQ
jgi:hypothetical protein